MDPVGQLLARDQHGIKFGLSNIRTLCAALDHPERYWKSLIVAGTNGKGSVTAMAAAALTAAGYRTGRYTSPHLVTLEERIAVDGHAIDADHLRAAAAHVLAVEDGCLRSQALAAPVTFFEITTATAFEAFRRAGTDVVVLEVGMGGRFDATNAADPLAGAITSIAFDHMRFLGDTLAEIAFEKAGILRHGRPVVLGPLPPDAESTICLVAAERQAPIVHALAGVSLDQRLTADGRTRVTMRTPAGDYGTFTLGLRGRHQVLNAVIAARLLEEAGRAGLPVPPAAVVRGLADVSWPARLQVMVLESGREVLLDAAHNPAGAATLAAYLADIGARPRPFVFGAMRDKDVTGMLRELAPHASMFVFCQAHSARAMSPTELVAEAERAAVGVPVVVASTPVEGLEHALRDATHVVVAGSIFLIGDLLPHLEARVSTAAP